MEGSWKVHGRFMDRLDRAGLAEAQLAQRPLARHHLKHAVRRRKLAWLVLKLAWLVVGAQPSRWRRVRCYVSSRARPQTCLQKREGTPIT